MLLQKKEISSVKRKSSTIWCHALACGSKQRLIQNPVKHLIMSVLQNYLKAFSRISSNKGRASNKRRPLMNAEALGIHIKMSASSLISAAYLYLNATLIRIVTIFY